MYHLGGKNMYRKTGGKTEFYRNGFLATLGSTFQEGQN
jgi:hypothetical protein